jgi:hypothetical protein
MRSLIVLAGAGLSLVFLATGAGVCIWSAFAMVDAVRSRHWPEAAGVITQSTMKIARDADGGPSYGSNVTYTDTVNDQQFTGRRVRFGDVFVMSYAGPIRRIMRRYPVGKPVIVRFDPSDPKIGVLEPGFNGLLASGALYGVLQFLIGMIVARQTL